MQSWVKAGVLAAVTAGGMYLAVAGAGSPSHCGPCLTCPHAADRPAAGCPGGACGPGGDCCPDGPCCPGGGCCPTGQVSQVTAVVDVTAALAAPRPAPAAAPFVSFDEPPLAKPVRPADPGVVQAAFIAPVVDEDRPAVELAPMPRAVPAPAGEPGGLRLLTADSPF